MSLKSHSIPQKSYVSPRKSRNFWIVPCCTHTTELIYWTGYGVATISRLLKIIGLFCRISSLLQGSFAKETYNLKESTIRSHPIALSRTNSPLISATTFRTKATCFRKRDTHFRWCIWMSHPFPQLITAKELLFSWALLYTTHNTQHTTHNTQHTTEYIWLPPKNHLLLLWGGFD